MVRALSRRVFLSLSVAYRSSSCCAGTECWQPGFVPPLTFFLPKGTLKSVLAFPIMYIPSLSQKDEHDRLRMLRVVRRSKPGGNAAKIWLN